MLGSAVACLIGFLGSWGALVLDISHYCMAFPLTISSLLLFLLTFVSFDVCSGTMDAFELTFWRSFICLPSSSIDTISLVSLALLWISSLVRLWFADHHGLQVLQVEERIFSEPLVCSVHLEQSLAVII